MFKYLHILYTYIYEIKLCEINKRIFYIHFQLLLDIFTKYLICMYSYYFICFM